MFPDCISLASCDDHDTLPTWFLVVGVKLIEMFQLHTIGPTMGSKSNENFQISNPAVVGPVSSGLSG
jgi:hypothetical protein